MDRLEEIKQELDFYAPHLNGDLKTPLSFNKPQVLLKDIQWMVEEIETLRKKLENNG